MCHSSDRWTFWSRQQQTTEPVNRSAATPAPTEAAARKSAVGPQEDERTWREKELESLL